MKTLVCMGDSLVEGEGDERAMGGWVGRVAQRLSPNVGRTQKGWQVYNLGIGGDSIKDVHQRLGEVLVRTPDVIILGCGANDFVGTDARGRNLHDVHLVTWRKVLQKLKSMTPNLIVTFGMHAQTEHYRQNWRADFGENFAKHEQNIMKLCVELDIAYIQLSASFADENILSDGLHYNAKGYDILAQLMFETLEEFNWIKE